MDFSNFPATIEVISHQVIQTETVPADEIRIHCQTDPMYLDRICLCIRHHG